MTDSHLFARGLASADENTQAEFLNAFTEHLRAVCNQGHGWNTQTCYIGKHLHVAACEVLASLVDYRRLHSEEAGKLLLVRDGLHAEVWELKREVAELATRKADTSCLF